jgi:hypothetical protein
VSAPTVAVAPDSVKRRCVITVTATVGDTITLWRSSESGTAEVRGAVDIVTVAGETVFADYELPQNVAVSYFASGDDGAGASVSAGVFDFGGDVIFDLGNPANSILVTVESLPSLDFSIERDVVTPWDRPDPVVVSGRRRMPSGTLTLLTLEQGDRVALYDVLMSGNIVAFSPWKPEYGLNSPSYFSVGTVRQERTSRIVREQSRRWSLEVQQVAPPRSSYVFPVGSVTWQDLLDSGDTWTDLLGQDWYEVSGF